VAMLQQPQVMPTVVVHFGALALHLGDGDDALRLANIALTSCPQLPAAALLEGRVALSRGDLEWAGAALDRALLYATSSSEKACVLVVMAELSLTCDDAEASKAAARRALELTTTEETRLDARNVLGKWLLREAKWQAAEQHFAQDGRDANLAKLSRSELRARLNRAVARLQAGGLPEAATLLAELCRDAEQRGDHQALGLAAVDLAVVNMRLRRYAQALQDWELGIMALRRGGDKRRLYYAYLDCAQLRLELGLTDDAKEALALATAACPTGGSSWYCGLRSYVEAGIHFQQGQTAAAAAVLAHALAVVDEDRNSSRLVEFWLLSARIASSEGDVGSAAAALAHARRVSACARDDAVVEFVAAACARAAGQPFEAMAQRASEYANAGGDREVGWQANTLLALAQLQHGDEASARRSFSMAQRQRAGMLAELPEHIQQAYLRKREMALYRELEHRLGEVKPSRVRHRPPVAAVARRMLGSSAAMRRLQQRIRRVGGTHAPVLIVGETGTGKELVAEALHQTSARAGAPLIKVNCAALVETLLLSELFGHERGAFTGAVKRRRGLFEQAHGGTLFLDEIGDISAKTQVALLRVLQDGTFERVGGSATQRVDVRVICATHRDLLSMVKQQRFREDLYYRLCGVTLDVPPLRQRLEDLPALSASIIAADARQRGVATKTISAAALTVLARHHWPGNVRELENVIRTVALFTKGDIVGEADLAQHAPSLRGGSVIAAEAAAHKGWPVGSSDVVYQQVRAGCGWPATRKRLEKACLKRALEEADDNIAQAARLLGMKRPRVSQLVHQYGLKKGGDEALPA
ncbi:MAG TPA: AAA family ATPase, partial [Sorangium sp.]|nr:AAA family ATPase [Sorangium sp.]